MGRTPSERVRTADMTSPTALKAAKKELRTLMKHKLLTLSKESVEAQSRAVFKAIKNFIPYEEAKRIGIYLSMPTGEIQTDAIVRHAIASGKKVFIPYLHKINAPSPATPCSVMDMVDLHSLADYDSLKRDKWGIPTVDAATVDLREHILENAAKESNGLDMILIPGVAFDIDPNTGFVRRLGHGKGFYDYFLHRYRSRTGDPALSPGTNVLLYGLALEEQFLKDNTEVPVGKHDSLLHGLVVGNAELLKGPIR